jgi:carbon storage regulator
LAARARCNWAVWLARESGVRSSGASAKEAAMLTLTRKAGQKIRIGEDIEIVVREIRGKQVRLGIIAPTGLTVFREELYQQILSEAAQPDPDPDSEAPPSPTAHSSSPSTSSPQPDQRRPENE